ncbi:MFS general substrate transporter [Hesseltinella vesiculosa]|uniref:MFS general substrate transporter n=1 Tax=Hesseltinella vesiculosa TaxID=101127 RepID=A0A1X2GJY4_9FUNG|nr:MFS general substrate transporter [Hesseltinella vesiculosa]
MENGYCLALQQRLQEKILRGVNLYVILSAIWIGVALASIDGSIVANILPMIGTEFHRSNEMIWVATTYVLSFASFQPLYGRISDIFGRKSTYLFTLFLFFIGSIMCGIANDMWTLIVGRALAGIGGGGLGVMNSIITNDLIPLKDRGKYSGYANIFFTVGGIMGAPVGGFIAEAVGWRWCFFLNVPVLVAPLYIATVHMWNYNLEKEADQQEETGTTTVWRQLSKIDFLGAALNLASILAFMTACSIGGNTRPWTDSVVIGLLMTWLLLTLLFLYVEKYKVALPLMPWHVITQHTVLACSAVCFFVMASNFANTYMIPIYYQALLNYTPVMCGVFVVMRLAGGTSGILFGGFYMSRTKEYRKYMIVNGVVQLVAMASICFWTVATPLWVSIPGMAIEAFASMSITSSALLAMLAYSKDKDSAVTTSISYLFRTTGGIIGLSLSQAIFQAVIKSSLEQRITDPDLQWVIDVARKSMTDVRDLVPAEMLEIVLDAYQAGIRCSFIFCMAAVIVTFAGVLCVKHRSL